ncbi:hypothetical protein [Xanthomonas floridensis]|uniref:Uncharacterized protein n=1 Tax=Xanthomonas floridensis TaxID=1843580 RepID=A0A1A9M7A8_9XANT|nr:hypothetical protein [Xanthomonas floridensis]MEA5123985.1 hypothetical protein [Xanthomonas floridensis]MEA5131671.1 hypothetical protein [Xanthomonas floridensis]OAG65460.1 hypothetical protein A7D17_08425 [Xanthomonas floridensis]
MAPKNTKNAPGHDDVSGLFARLGTQASEGYHDFAYTQLPPRKPGAAPADAPASSEAAPPAPDAVTTAPPTPAPAPRAPAVHAAHAAAPADEPAELAPADALAPLRKLRQLDESGPRGLPAPERPAHTPLERLFQRLLQADARASAHSPLKRLRSR